MKILDVVMNNNFCVYLFLLSQEEMENKAMYLSTYEEQENSSLYEEAYNGPSLSKLNLCDEGKESPTVGSWKKRAEFEACWFNFSEILT